MGKKHRHQHQQRPHAGPVRTPTGELKAAVPQAPAPGVAVPEEIEKLDRVHAALVRETGAGALPAIEPAELPDRLDLEALRAHCAKALEVRKTYEQRERKLEDEKERLELAQMQLDEDRKKLDVREGRLSEDRHAVQRELAEAKKERDAARTEKERYGRLSKELDEREDAVAKAEAEAHAGFHRQREEALARTNELVQGKLEELEKLTSTVADRRLAWEREHQDVLDRQQGLYRRNWEQELERQRGALENVDALLRGEREQLEARELAVRSLEKTLERKRQELDLDELDLAERRKAFDARIERAGSERLAQANQDLTEVRERLERVTRQAKERDDILVQYEHFFSQVAGADGTAEPPSPQAVAARLKHLHQENENLRAQIRTLPSLETQGRLDELMAAQQQWQADRVELTRQRDALQQELDRRLNGATALQSVQDRKKVLEHHNALLRKDLEELGERIDQLTDRRDAQAFYPNCSAMDLADAYQQRPQTSDQVGNLAAFVADLQQRIAYDPDEAKRLYYSIEDLRIFVAGLAMSPLHILQGISGTGKTSLPRAFAQAVGTPAQLIEVQAGWRDRHDLIGHHNAFERRYYEHAFLQALYRAQTPAYADRPCIVILDEMNLSRPEQYFADVLSALEQPEGSRWLKIYHDRVPGSPRLFKDEEGRELALPPNLWFVGTANHDETTLEFADKTYDRAHVMELPRGRESFAVRPPQPRGPVSNQVLRRAFDDACRTHADAAGACIEFLEVQLREPLDAGFQVGWGNRLERQLRRFVPVVIAAGGSRGEALDHVIATKFLRKVRDRFDTRPEDIDRLRETLLASWDYLDDKHQPRRSLAVLDGELRRLAPARSQA